MAELVETTTILNACLAVDNNKYSVAYGYAMVAHEMFIPLISKWKCLYLLNGPRCTHRICRPWFRRTFSEDLLYRT